MNVLDLDARQRQRVDLVSWILICTGDSCVTEQHLSIIPRLKVFRHSFTTRVSDKHELGVRQLQEGVEKRSIFDMST